jgi:hypothetical protein
MLASTTVPMLNGIYLSVSISVVELKAKQKKS